MSSGTGHWIHGIAHETSYGNVRGNSHGIPWEVPWNVLCHVPWESWEFPSNVSWALRGLHGISHETSHGTSHGKSHVSWESTWDFPWDKCDSIGSHGIPMGSHGIPIGINFIILRLGFRAKVAWSVPTQAPATSCTHAFTMYRYRHVHTYDIYSERR